MRYPVSRAIAFFLLVISSFSCKKYESEIIGDWNNELLDFSIQGQLYPVLRNNENQSLLSVVPANTDKARLRALFSLSPGASIQYNGTIPVKSNSTLLDFSQNASLTVKSKFNQKVTNWTLTVKSEPEILGMGTQLNSSRSLNRTFNFYWDQKGTGTYSSINCGPTVTTMAAKWADSTYNLLPVDARNTIRPSGGWWYTNDIVNYLNSFGLRPQIIRLTDIKNNIKACIDKNYVVILCLDMYYVSINLDDTQQTNKFYQTNNKDWGHFILIKGYREVDGKFYLEAYDPYSWSKLYFINNELKGKNRYYLKEDIKQATDVWWPYAIVIPPKGQTVNLTANVTKVANSQAPSQKGF
jgi:hypothetical protein